MFLTRIHETGVETLTETRTGTEIGTKTGIGNKTRASTGMDSGTEAILRSQGTVFNSSGFSFVGVQVPALVPVQCLRIGNALELLMCTDILCERAE